MRQLTFSIASFLLITLSCTQQNSVVIKGVVIDRPLDTLILFASHLSPSNHGIEIPIQEDGTFYLEFTPEHIEEYQVAFKSEVLRSAYRNIPFYPDGNTIEFELYNDSEAEKNKITGSQLTNYQTKHFKKIDDMYSPLLKPLYNKYYQLEVENQEKINLKSQIDSIEISKFQRSIEEHKLHSPIVGFNEFVWQLEDINGYSLPLEEFEKHYEYWIKKYPSHPLTERAINKYTALTGLHNEKKYVDFETIDNANKSVSFSTLLNQNKYTLLDLWAPWCGPCIRKSKKVQVIYDDLSSMGLSVFSVVGGIKSKEEYDSAINRLDYPWPSYIEIKNQNRIWEKYGISHAGGSQFLFDNAGNLIAINPTIDALKEIIKAP